MKLQYFRLYLNSEFSAFFDEFLTRINFLILRIVKRKFRLEKFAEMENIDERNRI